MKIFGIGLNKTGTTTLGLCFKKLGYNHLSCRRDLLISYRAGKLRKIFDVIDNFESFEDWPYPLMYRELFENYPNAKFILTERKDAQTWLRSLSRHSLTTHPTKHLRKLAYGYDYPFGAEEEHLAIYTAHSRDVVTFFMEKKALDRLLIVCWENGDGWPKLAKFLGVEAPDEALPHLNRAGGLAEDEPRVLANRRRSGFWGDL